MICNERQWEGNYKRNHISPFKWAKFMNLCWYWHKSFSSGRNYDAVHIYCIYIFDQVHWSLKFFGRTIIHSHVSVSAIWVQLNSVLSCAQVKLRVHCEFPTQLRHCDSTLQHERFHFIIYKVLQLNAINSTKETEQEKYNNVNCVRFSHNDNFKTTNRYDPSTRKNRLFRCHWLQALSTLKLQSIIYRCIYMLMDVCFYCLFLARNWNTPMEAFIRPN